VTLFQLDLALDHVWFEDGSFSLEIAQKQLRGVLEVSPKAAIFLRLHVRPPKWWMRKYPEENTTYFGSDSMPDLEGRVSTGCLKKTLLIRRALAGVAEMARRMRADSAALLP
jgi:hypothetical protein